MAVQRKLSSENQAARRPASASRATEPNLESESDGEGYDADEEPIETGLASQTVALDEVLESAEEDAESRSIDPDDLGSHTLRAATQQYGAGTEEEPDYEQDTGMEPAGVDLARNDIRNGSLFDQPRKDAPGAVRHPFVRSNEVDAALEQSERARRARSKH